MFPLHKTSSFHFAESGPETATGAPAPVTGTDPAPATDPATAAAPAKPSLEEQLRGQVQETALMARLVADPDIRKIMDMRQRGLQPRIMTDEELAQVQPPKAAEPEAEPDYENLSPKQLAALSVKQTVQAIMPELQKMIQPIQQRLDQVSEFAQTSSAERVKTEISEAQKLYPDLAQYGSAMKALSAEMGGKLGVKELYFIAKSRAGQQIAPPVNTQSERPQTAAARPSLKSTRKVPLAHGAQGWEQMLDQALDRLNFDITLDS